MNPDAATLQKIAANIPAAIAAIQAKLKPLMDRFGASTDPVYDSFTADHTGLDAMFDAVQITCAAGKVVVSNKKTSGVILNCPVNGISSATFNTANMPSASGPTPAQAPTSALYDTNCAGCHGPLATSSKRGATVAQIQAAIAGNFGGMGRFSTLSAADIQSIADALSGTTTPAAAPVTTPTTEGATLYGSNCSGCHGPLASSSKLGRTATQIQAAITNNAGGVMGSLSSLSATQVQAIATALVSSTPAPPAACGSCHAIPPRTGHHSTNMGATCATCHGTGYSNTTVNAATHNNGVVNVASTIGWNATNRTCSNSCHGSKSW
jgi:mono/diheme cytochrome c family protein